MLRRIMVAAVTMTFAYSLSVHAQIEPSGDRIGKSKRDTLVPALRVRGEAAIDLLNKRVESVNWEDVPFDQIIDWLKQEGEGMVNVVPRWGPLSVETVDRDTPVSLELNNTTVAEVLNETMNQLSEDGELRLRAVGNTLTISTKADTDRKKYVRVYDVTDILFRVSNMGQSAPNIDLQTTATSGTGGGSGQSVFQGGSGSSSSGSQRGGQQAEQKLEDRLEELRELIEQTIAPETWDTNSGQLAGTGRIRIFRQSLVVYNTIEVHEMIAGRFSLSE